MPLKLIGVSHQKTPINIREKLAINTANLAQAISSFIKKTQINQAVIISTCNRLEIYYYHEKHHTELVITWLKEFNNYKHNDLNKYCYQLDGSQAISHLFCVASGLDSMALGEPQILGQCKTAYKIAKSQQPFNQSFDRIFQMAFNTAKKVRSETEIGKHSISIAYATVYLAKQIFETLANQTILLIGAGETIQLVASHLSKQKIKQLIIANRTLENASTIAKPFSAQAITLVEIQDYLPQADIIISSTDASQAIIHYNDLKTAIKLRKRQPIFIVDLAVPRDIDPKANNLEDIYLYSIDDMQQVIKSNLENRAKAAEKAKTIINQATKDFISWLKAQEATTMIKAYRKQGESIRDELLQKSLYMLEHGQTPEKTLEFLAHSITNKLMHTPSQQLKLAAGNDREDILKAAQTIFDINPDENID